ncbi:MAG: SDR family NAD(P)-dependent oxidoreductase [Terriglobia bacterium]
MTRGKRKTEPARWSPPNLKGKVAVVTGASRGAGRGIACVLGECGATVYVTGRSVRGGPTTDNMPGTIDDTAEQVSARGGAGIPVRCDHTGDKQVEALFKRVKKEQGRLDLLVNNAWGGYEGPGGPLSMAPLWEQPLRHWDGMFTAGLRAQLVASYFGVPLMLTQKRGLIVSTVAMVGEKYLGTVFYYVSKHAVMRMIHALACELRQYNVAAVALAPGFMRTERILKFFKTDEQHWQTNPALKQTESPEYVGRAVAMLAADRKLMQKTGKAFRSGELARTYGFPDVDGRRVPPFPTADEL